jgi:hypothetical protein
MAMASAVCSGDGRKDAGEEGAFVAIGSYLGKERDGRRRWDSDKCTGGPAAKSNKCRKERRRETRQEELDK